MKLKLTPTEKRVIPAYDFRNPEIGLEWLEDAKKFFGIYPIGSKFTRATLQEAVAKVLPDWLMDEAGGRAELNNDQVRDRLNAGGGNPGFGQPANQLVYLPPSRMWVVVSGMEKVDQLNAAIAIAGKAIAELRKLQEALQIADAQIRSECPQLLNQVQEEFEDVASGVDLLNKWAQNDTKSLGEAARGSGLLTDGNGNGHVAHQLEDAPKPVQKNGKK